MTNIRMLNIRYFFLQVLFWGAAVVNYAYMTQMLQYKGFTDVEIGILAGVKLLVSVVFQVWIGVYSDRNVYRVPLKYLIGMLSGASVVLTLWFYIMGHNFWVMLFISAAFGVCFTSISPLIDSLSMLYVNHGVDVNFAKGRAGGSFSWAVLCVLAGLYGDNIGVKTLPLFGAALIVILALLAFVMPWEPIKRDNFIIGKGTVEKPHTVRYLLKNYPVYTVFLVASALMFMGYNFGSVFLIDIFRGLGGNNIHYGMAEFVLAIAEVPSAFLVLKYRKKIPLKWMMLCCAVFMTLKNLIPTVSDSITVIILAQTCEMLGFGLFYAGGLYFITEFLPEKDLVKATTLISVATVGVGEGIASLVCGVIRSYVGLYGLMGVATLSNAAAVVVMLVMCLMKKSSKTYREEKAKTDEFLSKSKEFKYAHR